MNFYNKLLIKAINKGNINIIKFLLNKGIDINIKDEHGQTPLMEAVRIQNYNIVEFLIKNNADINIKDNYNWTALTVAISTSNINIIKLLIKNNAKINTNNKNSNLTMAYEKGLFEIVELFINNGANVNSKNYNNDSILELAIKNKDKRTINILLNKNATVSKQYNEIAFLIINSSKDKNIFKLKNYNSISSAA